MIHFIPFIICPAQFYSIEILFLRPHSLVVISSHIHIHPVLSQCSLSYFILCSPILIAVMPQLEKWEVFFFFHFWNKWFSDPVTLSENKIVFCVDMCSNILLYRKLYGLLHHSQICSLEQPLLSKEDIHVVSSEKQQTAIDGVWPHTLLRLQVRRANHWAHSALPKMFCLHVSLWIF